MRNLSSTLVVMSILTGCEQATLNINVSDSTVTPTPIYTSESVESSKQTPSVSPSPSPSPSSTPVVTGPCANQALPIQGVSQTFTVNTGASSSDDIVLYADCTWKAEWTDKTWNFGGPAYSAQGTFVFKYGNWITFTTEQVPSGITYEIRERTYQPNNPSYELTLQTGYTALNALPRPIVSGLAFQDMIMNRGLSAFLSHMFYKK